MKTIAICKLQYVIESHDLKVYDGTLQHIFSVGEDIPREDALAMSQNKEDLQLLLGMIGGVHDVTFVAPTIEQILDLHIRILNIETDPKAFEHIMVRYYDLPVWGNIVVN